ncbi:MAG: DUF4214 domain-containing protein [Acidimicrobiia bacterium]|nr:DUF4214 domain-containing protein [Acidimicrobiia bacterium]MDH5288646.1 DUF4214 domain-containing protein [Acidimicrobiia bacterium]
MALIVLAVGASLAPAGGPVAAAEVRAFTLPIQADQVAKVHWTDTYGAPRGGGRSHLGVDMLGVKMVPLVAVRSATIVWGKFDNAGGNYLRMRDDEGWEYQYIHLNNDNPDSDDGKASCEEAFSARICATVGANGRLAIGTRVAEGEVIGYLGDSGNAESTSPHLHFEIYRPNGAGGVDPINPTPSVDAALARLKGSPPPAGPVAAAPKLPAGPPPVAAPGQGGFADHLWYQVAGRLPTAAERAAFDADANTKGVWPAMAARVGDMSNAATVDRLYHAFFLRYPDTDGLRYWVGVRGSGQPVQKVADGFAASDEFRLRYPGTDFGTFIDQIYRNVLGREPDAGGRDYWLAQLANRKVTRGTIVASFSESQEMRNLTGWRNELAAVQLVHAGAAPTAGDEARWTVLRQAMPLPDAIASWYSTGR